MRGADAAPRLALAPSSTAMDAGRARGCRVGLGRQKSLPVANVSPAKDFSNLRRRMCANIDAPGCRGGCRSGKAWVSRCSGGKRKEARAGEATSRGRGLESGYRLRFTHPRRDVDGLGGVEDRVLRVALEVLEKLENFEELFEDLTKLEESVISGYEGRRRVDDVAKII